MGEGTPGGRRRRPVAGWLVSLLFLLGVALWGYLTVRETVPQGLAVGETAPPFQLTDLNGERVSLADFRGMPVVLRFSSRTCSFCYDDFDTLEQFQRRYDGQLQVIAVEVGGSDALVRNAVRGRNRSYPVVLDPRGEVAERYRLPSIPQLYFISAQGELMSRVAGELADLDVSSHVAQLLEPGRLSPAEVEARVRAIAQEVRCQECRGLSVWESNVASAWEMKEEIWRRVEAGETDEMILADLVDRYGVWILMRPPARGGFLWAYLAPFIFVAAGGLLIQRRLRHRTRPPLDGAGSDAGAPDPEGEARIQARLRDYL